MVTQIFMPCCLCQAEEMFKARWKTRHQDQCSSFCLLSRCLPSRAPEEPAQVGGEAEPPVSGGGRAAGYAGVPSPSAAGSLGGGARPAVGTCGGHPPPRCPGSRAEPSLLRSPAAGESWPGAWSCCRGRRCRRVQDSGCEIVRRYRLSPAVTVSSS